MAEPTRPTTPPPPAPATKEGAAKAAEGAPATPAGQGAPGAPGTPGTPKASQRTAPSERRTAAANAPKEGSGMGTAGKIAAGVAAAGVATAAGLLWGDQVTDALGITGEDEDTEARDAEAAAAAEAEADDSMDAFDAVAGAGGFAGGGGGGGFAGGGGGGGGGGFAPPRPRMRAEPDIDVPPQRMPGAPGGQPTMEGVAVSPEFLAARQQLAERLATWEPPEGSDPEEAAALRERLEGLLDRFRPQPGQSTSDAIASLRDEFEVRIDNFVQDAKIDALTEAQNEAGTGAPTPSPEFEAQRQQLLERLENWQPPEGTTPEQAEALRAELRGTIERAQPIPGQTVNQAILDLQQRFEDQVEDFVTEQKIDALVEQAQGSTTEEMPATGEETPAPEGETPTPTTEEEAPATEEESPAGSEETPADAEGTPATRDVEFEARRAELIAELENWEPAAGTDTEAAEARRTELLQQIRQAQPVPGQSIDASFPPVRSDPLLFNTGVVPPIAEPEPAPEPDAEAAEAPDPRVTTPLPEQEAAESSGEAEETTLPEFGLHTADGLPEGVQNLAGTASGLVDDFDAMAGIGDPVEGAADGVLTAPVPEGGLDVPPIDLPGVDPSDGGIDLQAGQLADIDVLGESMVNDAASEIAIETPGMVDVGAVADDVLAPVDDLGLDMPEFTTQIVEPEPIEFEAPDVEVPDFEPMPDLDLPDAEPDLADDSATDDLGGLG